MSSGEHEAVHLSVDEAHSHDGVVIFVDAECSRERPSGINGDSGIQVLKAGLRSPDEGERGKNIDVA